MNLSPTQEKVLARIIWELADEHERAAIAAENPETPAIVVKPQRPVRPTMPEVEAARQAIRIAIKNGMSHDDLITVITSHPYWTGQKDKNGNWTLKANTLRTLENTGYTFYKPTQIWRPYLALYHCMSIIRILRIKFPEIPQFVQPE